MMTKLKCDLENEIDTVLSSSPTNESNKKQQEHNIRQIRSQINHLDEQMKCVVFLLMQYQIGLETCGDMKQSPNL